MLLARLIRFVGRVPLLGWALTWAARCYREGSLTKIWSGAGAGLKWRRFHRYRNRYWLGQHELPLQRALQRAVSPGMTVFDVGANAGFFSVISARLAGPGGTCVAFDPLPENAASVREQFELNGFSHGTVFEGAVGARDGTAAIAFHGPGDSAAHLGTPKSGERTIEVPMLTLDSAARRFGRPQVVKVDVEGAEVDVLRGAAELLREAPPTWILEVHDARSSEAIRTILGAGYGLFTLEGDPIPAGHPLAHHVLARATAVPVQHPD